MGRPFLLAFASSDRHARKMMVLPSRKRNEPPGSNPVQITHLDGIGAVDACSPELHLAGALAAEEDPLAVGSNGHFSVVDIVVGQAFYIAAVKF